ncbi:hypothetical protein F4804DRAFT_337165 [Jackrogersella minutella]|nr:hypothetical protein F4804DRAFT_337165 [Jackrogersella minutella]
MVAVSKSVLIMLGASAVHAAVSSKSENPSYQYDIAMKLMQPLSKTTCPSGQQLIANNKCCPGFAIVSGDNDTACCVVDSSDSNCKGIGLCGNGSVSSCKAKVETTDPDYDQKVQDALSGTATSQTGSSSSSAAGSTLTSTASSASSTASSDSGSGSGSSSSTKSSSTPSETAATGAGVSAEANKAIIGLVVALAAVPAAFYAL